MMSMSLVHRSLVVVIVAVSLALIVVLARQNRLLRSANLQLFERATRPYAGFTVPEFRTATLEGDSVTLGRLSGDETGQLLFFFTTTCGFCKRTIPTWNTLAMRANDDFDSRAAIYGVVLDSGNVEDYVKTNGVAFPVVRLHDARALTLYRAKAVPLTVLIGPKGRIRLAHFAEFTKSTTLDSLHEALRDTTSLAVMAPSPMP